MGISSPAMAQADKDDRVGLTFALDRDDDGHMVVIHVHSGEDSFDSINGSARYIDSKTAKAKALELISCMEDVLGGVFGEFPPGNKETKC